MYNVFAQKSLWRMVNYMVNIMQIYDIIFDNFHQYATYRTYTTENVHNFDLKYCFSFP